MITLGHLVVLVRARTLARPDVPPLPSFLHANLNRIVLVVFLLAIASYVPSLLAAAARGDEKWQHAIPITLGDDNAYQILAVNVLHGLGYAERLLLPVEEYRLEAYQPKDPRLETASSLPQFRRAPGLALMLAASYKVFGPETIVARRTMAVLAWLTALCLLLTGSVTAGWIGSVAGGLTALYHLNYFSGMYSLERILSENPTAFWVALFGLTFTLFLRRNRSPWLVMSALSLSAVILMRANFIIALPLLALYLARVTRRGRPVALFV